MGRKDKEANKGHDDDDTTSKGILGTTKEIGNHVYVAGTKQQHHFTKISNAIADYVGTSFGMNMRMLVKEGKDSPPSEPQEPTPEDAKKPVKMKQYEKKLDQYYKELALYEKTKEKVFIIILGQCNLAMVNQLEAKQEYKAVESSANVPRLLEMIKEIVYSSKGVQYEYWAMSYSVRKVVTIKQGKSESLTAYYNRFIDLVLVAESQWGAMIPYKMITTVQSDGTTITSTDSNDRLDARNKYLACVFLAGTNQRYGGCLAELNNSFISGIKKYPKTPSAALELLNNYMVSQKSSMQDEKKDEEEVVMRNQEGAQFTQDCRRIEPANGACV